MTRTIQMTVLLALTCLMTLGCQPYVNIPSQAADTASHDPNGKTARGTMIVALRAALDDATITGPVQIMLPEHTTKLTYAHVASELGDQAVLPDEEDVAAVVGVIFAKAVRVRGHEGEVDVVRPIGQGLDQLVTVHVKWRAMGGWGAESVRVWRGVPIQD